jgi:CRP-like cAMP-binding protein
MDIAGIEYRQTMDNLNSYLDECDAPAELRFKLREYFTLSRDVAKQKFYLAVIDQLSPGLKAELAGFVNNDWIEKIYFLAIGSSEKSQHKFTAEVAMRLTGRTYPSTEYVIRMGDSTSEMFIIQKGLVARMNAVLSTGRHFGEDVVLHNALRLYTVRALTFLSVYVLKREDLEDVLFSPDFMYQKKVVRRATIKLAMRNDDPATGSPVRSGFMDDSLDQSVHHPKNTEVRESVVRRLQKDLRELVQQVANDRSTMRQRTDEQATKLSNLGSTIDSHSTTQQRANSELHELVARITSVMRGDLSDQLKMMVTQISLDTDEKIANSVAHEKKQARRFKFKCDKIR